MRNLSDMVFSVSRYQHFRLGTYPLEAKNFQNFKPLQYIVFVYKTGKKKDDSSSFLQMRDCHTVMSFPKCEAALL